MAFHQEIQTHVDQVSHGVQTEVLKEEIDTNYLQGWNDCVAYKEDDYGCIKSRCVIIQISSEKDRTCFPLEIYGTQYFFKGVRTNSLLFAISRNTEIVGIFFKHATVDALIALNEEIANRNGADMATMFSKLKLVSIITGSMQQR